MIVRDLPWRNQHLLHDLGILFLVRVIERLVSFFHWMGICHAKTCLSTHHSQKLWWPGMPRMTLESVCREIGFFQPGKTLA